MLCDYMGPKNKFLYYSMIALCLLALNACNPIYVMQAAYEQSKILVARRPLEEVIEDPSTEEQDKIKLLLVERARVFSQTINLTPGATFTAYTKLEKDPVAWVLSASRKDAFVAKTWWYPIVGSFPYRGYFDKEDAIHAAEGIEKEGLESWVRGTAAFSTLGWFNDPLLSSTLRLPPVDVVNPVIHETVHATIWVPGSVSFNESLANYVGHKATIDFFAWLKNQEDSPLSEVTRSELSAIAIHDLARELDASDSFAKVYTGLANLYSSNLSEQDKVAQRDQVLDRELGEFRLKYPGVSLISKVNNAEIMQRKLYLTKLRKFDSIYAKLGSSWPNFIEQIRKIYEGAEENEQMIWDLLDKEAVEL